MSTTATSLSSGRNLPTHRRALLQQPQEAFAEQKQALQLDPNDADGWNNLGALLARGGQTDAARAAFEHALKIQPDHEQARANLARLSAQK